MVLENQVYAWNWWCFVCVETGVHSIAYTFPQIRIVSSAVDPQINEKFFVKPGIGNFGDRYFGTEPLQYQ